MQTATPLPIVLCVGSRAWHALQVALWQHPNKGALLSMMNTRHSPTLIIESLRTCRQLCFSGPGSSKLLEPALLTVASELLHPHMDLQVRGGARAGGGCGWLQPKFVCLLAVLRFLHTPALSKTLLTGHMNAAGI